MCWLLSLLLWYFVILMHAFVRCVVLALTPYAQCEEPVNYMYDAVNLAVCHQSRPIVISILQCMTTLLYLAPQ